MENNMAIYEQLRAVPKEAQTPFDNGKFKGTDIDPMWRIKRLTEVFGACGVGFKWGEPSFVTFQATDGSVSVHCTLALYIKTEAGEWSEPIWGVGGNTLVRVTRNGISHSDEGYKMAYTDAQSNAAKQIGLGADIWFAQDKTKYTAQDTAQKKESVKKASIVTGDVYAKLERVMTMKELVALCNDYPQFQDNEEFQEAFRFRKKEIQEGKI